MPSEDLSKPTEPRLPAWEIEVLTLLLELVAARQDRTLALQPFRSSLSALAYAQDPRSARTAARVVNLHLNAAAAPAGRRARKGLT